MHKTKIDIPIYFGYLIVIFTKDVHKIDKRYELGLEGRDYPAFVKGNRNVKGVSQYYMVFDTRHIDHGIIAHEVTHCANWIFYDHNIEPDLINDEPYAYLVGWITEKIYKFGKKCKLNI